MMMLTSNLQPPKEIFLLLRQEVEVPPRSQTEEAAPRGFDTSVFERRALHGWAFVSSKAAGYTLED